MSKEITRRTLTDTDVKRKAVKLVIVHLRKKITKKEFLGSDNVLQWITEMEKLLENAQFNVIELHQMRKSLNDLIERTLDEEIRFGLRDSWFSLGKALDKKVKRG